MKSGSISLGLLCICKSSDTLYDNFIFVGDPLADDSVAVCSIL